MYIYLALFAPWLYRVSDHSVCVCRCHVALPVMRQSMHVNGLPVLGRFDLSVYHCIVSPVVARALRLPEVSPTAVVQAKCVQYSCDT